MANLPEPRQAQLEHGAQDRGTRMVVRVARTMALGAVIGATMGGAAYAVCSFAGITVPHGLAVGVWTGLIGVIGPVIAHRVIAERPRWFDSGYDGVDSGPRP
jgi:hypothetical protein